MGIEPAEAVGSQSDQDPEAPPQDDQVDDDLKREAWTAGSTGSILHEAACVFDHAD